MYIPYLYARQGECRAIDDVAPSLASHFQAIIPLLEPVNDKVHDLTRTLNTLIDNSASSYVIVNPNRHKLQTQQAQSSWLTNMSQELANPLVRPTLEIRRDVTLGDLRAFVKTYSGRAMGISIRVASLSPADIKAETGSEDVIYFVHASADPSGYTSGLGAPRTIEVRDSFRKEARNADYIGEEPFTSAHQHFSALNQPGFSDYTILPGSFNASGGPLGAAVIHMSYASSTDKSLWVQHFVSNETRQYESTQPAKLLEAMAKLDSQILSTPSRFVQSPGIVSYNKQFASKTPTSPTYNKRQQISHHISTVATLI